MDSKKELQSLIETIKSRTGLTQLQIGQIAGYGPKYLSEVISKDSVSKKIIDNLKKTFTVILENATYGEGKIKLLITPDASVDDWKEILSKPRPGLMDVLGAPHHGSQVKAGGNDPDYKEKYIQLLEKQLDTANSQLTTALQTISTSLKEMVELQRVDVAQSKTLLQLEAEHEARGDKRKEEQALDRINKRLASNLVT